MRRPYSPAEQAAADTYAGKQEAEVKRLRERLAAIKQLVCGERHPNWTDQGATTATRGRIADLCDLS